jgi:hypothetical protein
MVLYDDGILIQKRRQEVLTHGLSIFEAEVSRPETVDDMDDDPLCVCHDEDLGNR